jgi:hypothetical protein
MKEAFFFSFIFFYFLFFSLIKNNRPTARRRVRRRGFLIIYFLLFFIFIFFGSRERRNLSLPLSPSFVVSGYFRGEKEAQSQCRHIWTMGFPACRQKIA